MNVLENFKDLFLDVWKEGVSGVNISEIIIALSIFIFFLFLRGVFSKFVIKRLEKPKSFLAKKLSSSLDNQIDSIANTLEERAQWQKFGL